MISLVIITALLLHKRFKHISISPNSITK